MDDARSLSCSSQPFEAFVDSAVEIAVPAVAAFVGQPLDFGTGGGERVLGCDGMVVRTNSIFGRMIDDNPPTIDVRCVVLGRPEDGHGDVASRDRRIGLHRDGVRRVSGG